MSRAIVWAGVICHAASAAHAGDDFVASLRLRGGFDTNPVFSNGGGIGGSAFIGTDTELVAGTREKDYSYGIAAEASTTQKRQVFSAFSDSMMRSCLRRNT